MSNYNLYVGIDISAKTAHIHWVHPQSQQRGKQEIPQNKTGYKQLAKALLKVEADAQHTHLVMEATGNYWLALALFAYEQGFAVSVINPVQGKNFARIKLRRAKTDPIDARMLSDYAQTMQPDLWSPPPQIYHDLQQRLALRDDLVLTRTQFRNRIHAMKHHPHLQPDLLDILYQQIQHLNVHIDHLQQEIQQLLNSQHQWQQAVQHLVSIRTSCCWRRI
jgi:transposase